MFEQTHANHVTRSFKKWKARYTAIKATVKIKQKIRKSVLKQAVWQALLALPRGQTCTYGELSQRIGRPSAVRATGGAIGRNPLSVIVPCHRVIGQGGALTGYAAGLARKRALLQLEGALPVHSSQA